MKELKYSDFNILEKIGIGTVGTLFKVQDIHDGNIYALKLLSEAVSDDALIVSRFEQEMFVLSKLQHPNIVSYIGHGRVDDQLGSARLFFIMEFVTGETIKDLLREKGPFPWLEAAECGRQICSALQHLHNQGIIHRDLKPGNIFVNEEGRVKLVDFGIAKDLHGDGLTDAGQTVGTYSYMPPELIRGNREITGQVDLYALGCNLFEMLTGRPPFRGDNFVQIYDQHLKSEPPQVSQWVPDCPEDMVKLVSKLLSKEPHSRPFNARNVQGQLTDLIFAHADSTMPGIESGQHETDENDVGAASIRLIQNSLSKRVGFSPGVSEISWRKLGAVLIVVVSLILFGTIMSRMI